MSNVVVWVVAALVVAGIVYRLRYHGEGIVARRGMSVGADLATMGDKPRVQVRSVTTLGTDRVHLLLMPEADPEKGAVPDLDLVVRLSADDFGFGLLHGWQQSGASLALVLPPGSHLVRLRSVDDLQPLTLNRIDDA